MSDKVSGPLISTPKQKSTLYLASSLCDGLEDNDLKQLTTLLKNKEADPNVLMPLHGITPFHLVIGNDSEAFAEEVTKLFLRHGGNPNVKSADGMTPVHVAAAWGRVKILELLLANGGDPLCLDGECFSPFHYAFQGEHYEAIAVLSKFCINDKEDNDLYLPKYKRELDKVLVKNGDLIAEYQVSDESSLDNSQKLSSLSKNSAIESSSCISSSVAQKSQSNDFVTLRRNFRKRQAEETTFNIKTEKEDHYDFQRDTVEEEINLINEIISQLSNSIASDGEATQSASFQNYENEYLNNCRSSSPKRKEITMVFNRPNKFKSNEAVEKNTNRRNSTLQVIKEHNYLPTLNNSKMTNKFPKRSTVLNSNVTYKKTSQPLSEKDILSTFISHSPNHENLASKWLDETIISKSPNFGMNTHSQDRKKKLIKTPIFEKKFSPIHLKSSKMSPTVTPNKMRNRSPKKSSNCHTPVNQIKSRSPKKSGNCHTPVNQIRSRSPKKSGNCHTPVNRTRSRSPNKVGNCHTPVSRIPKPKKYFITPYNIKSAKRNITPTVISYKSKVDSTKKLFSSEKNKTPLNQTFSKDGSMSSSFTSSPKHLNMKDYRNIAVNLNDYEYDDNEENLKEEADKKTAISNKTKRVDSKSSFIRQWLDSELVSGVGMLDSKSTSKSDIGSDHKFQDCSPLRNSADFNLKNSDSFSNTYSLIEKFNTKNKFNETYDPFNSVLCEKGSMLSDMSSSFLSNSNLSKQDNELLDNGSEIRKTDNEEIPISECHPISAINNSLPSSKNIDSETFLSINEEYKYEDAEEGVVFLERRLCVTPCATSDMNSTFYSCSTAKSEPLPQELYILDDVTLREKLRHMGENPGPITKTTRHLYLKKYHKLVTKGVAPNTKRIVKMDHEKELLRSTLLSIDWIRNLDDFEALEQQVFAEFATPSPSRKWREGTRKSSFNYLLLDPRITDDLPRRAASLTLAQKWETFLSAIFYVGKGKTDRPYAHLYDAFKIWVARDHQNMNSQKIQKILDIWNEGRGVVVLHVFHNTIPVEAYTREAAMIDVLTTRKLGNCKCGDYYGIMATMRTKEKFELGRYLLFKSMQILLLEGERQIFPDNL